MILAAVLQSSAAENAGAGTTFEKTLCQEALFARGPSGETLFLMVKKRTERGLGPQLRVW